MFTAAESVLTGIVDEESKGCGVLGAKRTCVFGAGVVFTIQGASGVYGFMFETMTSENSCEFLFNFYNYNFLLLMFHSKFRIVLIFI